MDNFNLTSYYRKQYLIEAEGEEKVRTESLISSLSNSIPEETPIKDFAVAVGSILKDSYGKHNFNSFMDTLHAELGMESLNEQLNTSSPEELEKELESMFQKYNPTITVGKYLGDRDDSDPLKGMGYVKIYFPRNEYFEKGEWDKMVGMVDSKEFKNFKEYNTSEYSDPGEQASIKFDFKLQ